MTSFILHPPCTHLVCHILFDMFLAGTSRLHPQIADQRTAEYPVTFALHVVLLLEHNRCCSEIAPDLGYEGDEVCFMFDLVTELGFQNGS